MFKKKQPEKVTGFTPEPMILPPEIVDARRKARAAKLNQSLEETVAEIQAEREARQREAWRNFGHSRRNKIRRNWHA